MLSPDPKVNRPAGYRYSVIPSEAKATLDVRLHPDTKFFTALEAEIKRTYGGIEVLPTMSTGASDKAQIRSKGVQCYGISPAMEYEDGAKGFGAHSDQERILVEELHRFVRFQYDVVMDVARAR